MLFSHHLPNPNGTNPTPTPTQGRTYSALLLSDFVEEKKNKIFAYVK
jgi:hypothetical protein